MAAQLESLKTKLLSSADASDLASLERILATVKLITETEKIESEKEQVDLQKSRGDIEVDSMRRQARLESTRLWLPITVPAASALLLAALTLVFQLYQLKKTTQLQQSTAQQASRAQEDAGWDAQWRGAIQTLAEAKTPDATVAGVTFLAIFAGSDRYRDPAHKLTLQYLARTRDPNSFRTLCAIAFGNVGWGDFEDLAQNNRTLSDRYSALFNQLKDPNTKDRASLETEEDNLYQNILFLNPKLVTALKGRPPLAPVNLESLILFRTNLSGVDFRHTSVRFSSFAHSDVSGADLQDISNFEGGDWNGTAWWKAKSMSAPLLAYLKIELPVQRAQEQLLGGVHRRSGLPNKPGPA